MAFFEAKMMKKAAVAAKVANFFFVCFEQRRVSSNL
jgi:hypothetical protein